MRCPPPSPPPHLQLRPREPLCVQHRHEAPLRDAPPPHLPPPALSMFSSSEARLTLSVVQ